MAVPESLLPLTHVTSIHFISLTTNPASYIQDGLGSPNLSKFSHLIYEVILRLYEILLLIAGCPLRGVIVPVWVRRRG